MNTSRLWEKVQGRCQRSVAKYLWRRQARMSNEVPYISFTYDDFPRSALHIGGAILSQFGVRGTYYASFGLMGTHAPTGLICLPDDAKRVLAEGHELGCHTFSHCDSWETIPEVFEASIIENRRALDELVPGASFESLAYPIAGPRHDTKRRMEKYFRCCRAGGQTYNVGNVDLNLLKAYFLEKSRENIDSVKQLIDKNAGACGWLIFATHDISKDPTPYGCTPSFFQAVVKYSVESGARILPVARVLDRIFGTTK